MISCFSPGLKFPSAASPFSLYVGSFTAFSVLTNVYPSLSFLPVGYVSSLVPSFTSPSSVIVSASITLPSSSFVRYTWCSWKVPGIAIRPKSTDILSASLIVPFALTTPSVSTPSESSSSLSPTFGVVTL